MTYLFRIWPWPCGGYCLLLLAGAVMAFSCEAGAVQSTDLHTALGVGAGRGPRGHETQATGLP